VEAVRHLGTLFVILIVPISVTVGVWAGGHPQVLPGFMRDALVEDTQAQVFEEAADLIEADFYKGVKRQKLLDDALAAAVKGLKDPFSAYFDAKSFQRFQEATSGGFEGVGMTVEEVKRGLRVVSVFDDSPAKRAGIKRGDLITAVNGTSLKGKDSEASTALIKGPSGTEVRLEVLRKGKRLTESMRRAQVDVPVVADRIVKRDGRVYGHIALAGFTAGAHAEVRAAVRRVKKRKATAIVLDLRNNGGGLLDEAVLVSSVFIGDGVIVSTRGRSSPARTFEATGKALDTKIPLVVLVNRASASASEIVTGAIQDRGRGKVVGERTFGKGVFQEIKPLTNGGALDITVGEYFTPKGRNLGPRDGKKGGIVPPVKGVDDPDTRRDEALEAALRALR
jgi:carboxyl-terminal processing protease